MNPDQHFLTILDKMTDYLTLLKEDGVKNIEVDRVTLAGLAAAGPAVSAPPSTETPAAAQTTRTQKPAPAAPSQELHFALAERMEECEDPSPPELNRLVVLSNPGSFTGKPGELLTNILKAAGYSLTSDAARFTQQSDLYNHAPRAILLMGEPALKALRPRATIMLAAGKFKNIEGIDTLCTFDPTYIETHSSTKKAVWQHIQTLLGRMDLPLPNWVKKK
jgi:hypothetical protein